MKIVRHPETTPIIEHTAYIIIWVMDNYFCFNLKLWPVIPVYAEKVVDNISMTKKALDFMKMWQVPPDYYGGPEMAPTWYMLVGSVIDDKSKTKKSSR